MVSFPHIKTNTNKQPITHINVPLYRKRGVIVNISSGAADFPLQLVAVYSSTKVCLWQTLSQSSSTGKWVRGGDGKFG